MILCLKTNEPEALLALYDAALLEEYRWQAHRLLAETIQLRIDDLLAAQGCKLHDISGIVAYQGPGSFNGLRIGLSVANALAYGLSVPIVGTTGDHWQTDGLRLIADGVDHRQVTPFYGAPVHITQPRK